MEGIRVSATVLGSSLAATGAIADFGIDEGVRMVNVRILDELRLELHIETERDVPLATVPKVCLVGRGWAPDDAGLSDRCWGEPDLERVVAAQLAMDAAGQAVLLADHPVEVVVTLRRGDVRCDYPPGTWQLEVALDPVIGGAPSGEVDLPNVSVEIPLETAGPLPFLTVDLTRYCGTASAVYREQGEPPLASPRPILP
ncbi:MAG: hypothetical protein ACRDQ2_13760 [Gaiellales bacterium]